eukprot:991856-Rhodomonas_salina.1
MQQSVDDAQDRALKRRKLVLELEQAEFALQQAQELHDLQHNERTLALLQSYEASSTIDAKTKQMLKDHALDTLLYNPAHKQPAHKQPAQTAQRGDEVA